ncbi:CehA/McbA family metallohydrolase [Microtetraspora sp. AC03309]|uniref:CehA/McbA family metallohydrolase n=1 Tax=Microtetraspora sp. AC03309 TaxID=2779376 RepID=UPI001E5F8157|nr:CehA/McbA family metallohydrolase [Microtetraspora sp. AC03309]MCC5577606.1 CehA/McbA family metallohydrolase [Microtetraspora sp. AC03309]
MHHDPLLPPPVARALEEYRHLLTEHGITWGEPPLDYVRMMTFLRFPEEADRMDIGADLDAAFRDVLGETLPDGLVALRLTPHGHRFEPGAVRAVVAAEPLRVVLIVDSSREAATAVEVDGTPYEIRARGALFVDIRSDSVVTVDGEPVDLSPLRRHAVPSRLRLRAGLPCRWSVTSEGGQGWYPEGAPHRVDYHGSPFFHGDDVVLDVPAESLTVRVTRGMEYDRAEVTLVPEPWRETLVELTPERIYDAAARGWYGADLHVHLNFAGDLVAPPAAAALMQHGEDLHVLNLVAGNVSGERVYDREALQHWAGRDLPWSDAGHIARMGVEYRNDLFGHVHAFGVTTPPDRFHTGFGGDTDWPPNATACGEMRETGAVLAYAHPFHVPITSPEEIIGEGRRNCSARAVVVDAALGLVDGMELLHFSDIIGTAEVYRRLIGAGNRLAALAGTDSMLSFTRQETVSSPLGWERVYARLDGPLTAEAYAEAIQRGRTFVTTGAWLELSVDGRQIGDTLDLSPGDQVTIRATAIGPEVERLEIRTADGVLAEGGGGELTAALTVTEPTYLVAIASGGRHPRSLHRQVYAHTSPIYLDVAGRHVARADDVRWCLHWLTLLEELVRGQARLDGEGQLRDHLDLVEKARAVYRSRL